MFLFIHGYVKLWIDHRKAINLLATPVHVYVSSLKADNHVIKLAVYGSTCIFFEKHTDTVNPGVWFGWKSEILIDHVSRLV